MDSKETAVAMATVLLNKKALDVRILKVEGLTPITDYFVICSGTSSTHIKALCDELEEKFDEKGIKPIHIEGYRSANWILADYGSVVVHIFNKEYRDFYNIERLWADAAEVELPAVKSES